MRPDYRVKPLTEIFGGMPRKSDIINKEESDKDIALSGSAKKPNLTATQRLNRLNNTAISKFVGL